MLPQKTAEGGTLTFELKRQTSAFEKLGRRRFNPFDRPSHTKLSDGEIFIDLRRRFPQNWAHFLNNHLPMCFAMMNHLDLTPQQILLILPGKTPGYIVQAADFFGFRSLCTSNSVEGLGIEFDMEPWIGVRSVRADLVKLPMVTAILNEQRANWHDTDSLPEKVFLSRRKTRALENEAEVEAHLAKDGYVKIYPEDLSTLGQLMLFEHAERIIAIHGAGLAPLLYISENTRLRKLVEIFPCGHMTDVYRVMAQQVGCKWIGVRGKIKPEHIGPAYDLEAPFFKYSLQSFEVDLESIDLAQEMLCQEEVAY
ncbi:MULTISPECIES: DUF563 domain-containing protein [unclassified Roseovarius]|uniref:glycosyltransferase family 61 protein n=1 Tax=unclassified Roseovarius TaxID=2614913 RepID=UPI00273F0502|nr:MULTISPECIES: glycosyltransferase 61 family protein [unclassified Roseovarius]